MRRLLVSAALTVFYAVSAFPAQFGLDPSAGRDSVYFRSPAKLEFIQGVTNNIEGSFSFEAGISGGPVSGKFPVDLRALKTGIEMRDGHMRDRHLHTDQYPYAYFELLSVSGLPATLVPGESYKASAEGYFYIHGVKRLMTADLEVGARGDQSRVERLDVRAQFDIRLDDYHIDRPKALFLKLAETIAVEVIFSGYNDLEPPSFDLPAWPEIR